MKQTKYNKSLVWDFRCFAPQAPQLNRYVFMKPKPQHLFLLVSLLLSGCGGAKLTEIERCIPRVSIYSTEQVVFYFVEVANHYDGYSYLENPVLDNNYLCFNDRTGNMIDQCASSYAHLGVKATLLPLGSKITLDGFAVKSVKWGFDTINTGPSPTTWFRSMINNRVVWVYASQLQWMYESNVKFQAKNIDAFNLLKLGKRIPDPIVRDSQGTPTDESWQRLFDQEKRIKEWNCEL